MKRALCLALCCILSPALPGLTETTSKDGKVHVTYWEKWTSFEGEAMRKTVEAFNASQDRIQVDLLTMSELDRKVLIATAGGDPPDVAGLWSWALIPYAQKNALTCLDDYAAQAGITPDQYIGSFYDQCLYQGHLYALPSVPASIALHWNKKSFRDAGLDPDKPPQTLQELDEMARKLTVRDAKGKIVKMGFLPPEPGWWNWAWGFWFGGELWDGKGRVTPDSPENLAAYRWVQGYAKEYGLTSVDSFRGGFGSFSSPQNAFLCGKVAMVLQGVWMGNFIQMFAPDLEWAAAPFPSAVPGLDNVTITEEDILVIPLGAKHPDEAFEFIRYVNSREGSEIVCMGQRKFTPLQDVSQEFLATHPNPFIQTFIDLAKSPNAHYQAAMGIWNEYQDEMTAAFEEIWLQQATPEDALGRVRERIQKKLDGELAQSSRAGQTQASPGVSAATIALFALLIMAMGLTIPAALCFRQSGFSKRRWLDLRNGLLFISPWMLGFGVFILYPVLASLYYSLTDFSVLQTPVFIGATNYFDLFKDDVFLKSLSNTFIYAFFALPLGMMTALTLALLLNTRVKGMAFYRTIFLLPSLVPLVAMAILWMWILNSQYGILNSLLASIHVKGPNWLNDTHWSKPAIILTSLWGVGQSMVIYLASLQDVPVELYEACELDGAGTWQKVRHVTVPMISPVIYFNLVMGIIGTLQIFAVPYIMTAGGPARSTLFYAMHLYDNAFRYMRMGYACAMAWILFIIIILLTLVATRLSSRHVHYAGR